MGNRIDTLSSTLLAMKELLTANNSNSMQQQRPETNNTTKEMGKTNNVGNKGDNVETSMSDTTIYQNVLQKDKRVVEVDHEITLNIPDDKRVMENCYSTSSEEQDQVDMSDEMMVVETVDIAEQFIVDCENEARRRKRGYPSEDEHPIPMQPEKVQGNARELADNEIRKAEAAKARMFATPGEMNFLVDN